MEFRKKHFWFLTILVTILFFTLPMEAQVNIGSSNSPESFSVLELNTMLKDRGLRLPQLTTKEREDSITPKLASNPAGAKGLVIYNTTIQCLEFWNGTSWISLCSSVLPVLEVNPENLVFEYDEITGKRVTVTTDISGWTTEITYNQGTGWLTISSVTGTSFVVAPNSTNSGSAPRTATITVTAGYLTEMVTVTQLPDILPSPSNQISNAFCGAFWKGSEIGERLIKINANDLGPWTAVVTYYDARWNPAGGDGVLLVAGGSTDPNVPYDTNEGTAANNAESHPVTVGSSSVSGVAPTSGAGTIEFRIGLQQTFSVSDTPDYSTTFPARYAVITLYYGSSGTKNLTHKIFLRQGEWADYLMTNADAFPTGTGTPTPPARTECVRFSPYNLTDPAGNTETDYSLIAPLAVGGGKFVDYPTQAGYSFHFNYNTKPMNPYLADYTNWPGTNAYGAAFWSAASTETCPAPYRRFNDVPVPSAPHNTTGPIAGSEVRQSLFWKPQILTGVSHDNSVWGYYADGFFDRRERATASGANAGSNTSVSTGNSRIAHVGNLFFNPDLTSTHYNASVFFPAAGSRYTNGSLTASGHQSAYWSSSSVSAGNSWFLLASGNVVYMSYMNRVCGYSVRCVR